MPAPEIAFTNIGWSGPFIRTHEDRLAGLPAFPGGVRNVAQAGGYSEFAEQWGPLVQATGMKRAWLHNPGGCYPAFPYYPDLPESHEHGPWGNAENRSYATSIGYGKAYTMVPDQWLIAEKNEISWADRGELKIFHYKMVKDFGCEEVVYYLGGPHSVPYGMQIECVAPFMMEQASFAFDAVYYQRNFEACEKIFKLLRKKGHKIYTEARPFEEIESKQRRLVDGTVARGRFDLLRPELLPQAFEMGEVIRLVNNIGDQHPDDGATVSVVISPT